MCSVLHIRALESQGDDIRLLGVWWLCRGCISLTKELGVQGRSLQAEPEEAAGFCSPQEKFHFIGMHPILLGSRMRMAKLFDCLDE